MIVPSGSNRGRRTTASLDNLHARMADSSLRFARILRRRELLSPRGRFSGLTMVLLGLPRPHADIEQVPRAWGDPPYSVGWRLKWVECRPYAVDKPARPPRGPG